MQGLRPNLRNPNDSSRTLTLDPTESQPIASTSRQSGDEKEAAEEPSVVLRLRGGPVTNRRIRWDEEVVDNEGLGRKKSKICCIYHKPKEFGESSSESSSSSSDSDDDADNRGPKFTTGVPPKRPPKGSGDDSDSDGEGKREECDHLHHHHHHHHRHGGPPIEAPPPSPPKPKFRPRRRKHVRRPSDSEATDSDEEDNSSDSESGKVFGEGIKNAYEVQPRFGKGKGKE